LGQHRTSPQTEIGAQDASIVPEETL
jgi:hypothetical protein